jgi:hypothetical protein
MKKVLEMCSIVRHSFHRCLSRFYFGRSGSFNFHFDNCLDAFFLALFSPSKNVSVTQLPAGSDNKRTGTTIKVSDGIRSERAFDLQKGDEGRRVSRLTSRGETTRRTTVFVLMY